jgi:Neurotransmitter-gated ion-channel ligand binding domain
VIRLLALLLLLIAAVPAAAQTAATAPQTPAAASPNATAPVQEARALTALPLDSGLPVIVRAGLGFVDVEAIDENEEAFTATVDLRLQWTDLRLRYPAEETPAGFREWRGPAVDAQLAGMWHPQIGIANMRGEPTRQSRSLRLYPDGRVEMLRRVSGAFGAPMDVQRFPFDRQFLTVELVSERETANQVLLDYRQDDLAFSRADQAIAIPGWDLGVVTLTRDPLPGWYGESYARLRVALEIDRSALQTVPGLFVPLLASLLIPLLGTWLNELRNGEFEIEAFEFTNILIGGLFAVIALSFTVYSERSILASGINTISMLFALNFAALAVAIVINVAVVHFGFVRRLAGRHVQHETFLFILWAMPVAVAAIAAALILIAAA